MEFSKNDKRDVTLIREMRVVGKKMARSGPKMAIRLYVSFSIRLYYVVVAVGSSGILKGKQKLEVTFNFNKQDIIDFMKFSKMTMYRASEANS